MCDNIDTSTWQLTGRGAEFTTPVRQAGFGLLTSIQIPGSGEMGLYQPRHQTAYDL